MGEEGYINQLKARVEIEAERRGWSLSLIAKKLSISPQALYDILNRNKPSWDTIERLAGVFDLDIMDIREPVTVLEYGNVMIPRQTLPAPPPPA